MKKIIKILTILILVFSHPASAYQPHDGYELDEYEIKAYLTELKKEPIKNEKEIVKFQRILDENIQDYVEYFIKYGQKVESK